jgi:hypothetical protein
MNGFWVLLISVIHFVDGPLVAVEVCHRGTIAYVRVVDVKYMCGAWCIGVNE